MKRCFLALALCSATACAHGPNVIRFDWTPHAPSSKIEIRHSMPTRAHMEVAHIIAAGSQAGLNDILKQALAMGCDAIVVNPPQAAGSTSVFGNGVAVSATDYALFAIAIRFSDTAAAEPQLVAAP